MSQTFDGYVWVNAYDVRSALLKKSEAIAQKQEEWLKNTVEYYSTRKTIFGALKHPNKEVIEADLRSCDEYRVEKYLENFGQSLDYVWNYKGAQDKVNEKLDTITQYIDMEGPMSRVLISFKDLEYVMKYMPKNYSWRYEARPPELD